MYRLFPYLLIIWACFFCVSSMAQMENHVVVQPSSNIRALHLVTRGSSVKEIKHIIDLAKSASFNTIVLGICWRNSTALKSMPWIHSPHAWKPEELLSVVNYARSKGMEVIPNIPLLSHQKIFLKKPFPGLMYNKATYDPRNPKVYEIVFPILDEIIDLLHPTSIHIGHDEVAGWTAKHYEKGILNPGEKILPANLFLEHVLKVHDYLKSRGVGTWMWGDMLISPGEFPAMKERQLNGSAKGYGAALRKDIPKDIVICDWHYSDRQRDYPSLNSMQSEGFSVIGATWKKEKTIRNFSRYAATHGASGMMATTWTDVTKKRWDVVKHIIKVSGEAFSHDFPDAK